jgi:hypothetical protein
MHVFTTSEQGHFLKRKRGRPAGFGMWIFALRSNTCMQATEILTINSQLKLRGFEDTLVLRDHDSDDLGVRSCSHAGATTGLEH